MAKAMLADLIGSADNLSEPIPQSNRKETIQGVTISLMILAVLCSILRLYTRVRILKAPGWDDLLVGLAQCSILVGNIVVCFGPDNGMGKHFILLGGLEPMQTYLKGFYIANGTYLLSTSLIKLALLLQYLRVPELGQKVHRFCYGLIIFVSLWSFAFVIIAWFPCAPIGDYWSMSPTANCWGFASADPDIFRITFTTHCAANMVLDLVILTVPAVLFFKKELSMRGRWGLIGILCIGALASMASIWRLATIIIHGSATKPTFDPSWYGASSIIQGVVELNLGMVCASVPIFWPVIERAGFQIFVTKEVEITSEMRLESMDDDPEAGCGRVSGASGSFDLRHSKANTLPGLAMPDPALRGIPAMHDRRGRKSGSVSSGGSSSDTLHNTMSRHSSADMNLQNGGNGTENKKEKHSPNGFDEGMFTFPEPGQPLQLGTSVEVSTQQRRETKHNFF